MDMIYTYVHNILNRVIIFKQIKPIVYSANRVQINCLVIQLSSGFVSRSAGSAGMNTLGFTHLNRLLLLS